MLKTMLGALLGFGAERNAMLDTMLEEHDAKVFGLPELIRPPPDADARNSFTSTVPFKETSMARFTPAQRLRVAPTMIRLMREMGRSARFYERPREPQQRQAEPELVEQLEALAAEHGATAVRYVVLPDDCIFEGKAVPHRNAIIYTVRMSKEALDTAPSFEAFHEVAQGYLRMAIIGNRVTELLRQQGHDAYPGTALGGLTDYTRLAELAGLGTIGYHGLLITPGEGALLRLNTIYTSVGNLPMRPREASLEWVRDFCAMCRKCVRSCPVDAIHPEPIRRDNGRVECIETTTCLDYFAANYGCAICADVCPFTQRGFDVIQQRFKGNPQAPRYRVPLYEEQPPPAAPKPPQGIVQ